MAECAFNRGLEFMAYVRTRAFASVAWGRHREGLCQGPVEILEN